MGQVQRTYNRLWQKASRFYGAQGQPPPRVHWVSGPAGKAFTASTFVDPDGVRAVSVGRFDGRALAGKNPHQRPWVMRPQTRRQVERVNRQVARKNMLHEWAHIYQKSAVLDNPVDSLKEYDASHFAHAVAKRILARRGKRQKLPLDRSQFGSNYGANPLTLPWYSGN